ncbi:unnamed protein product [Fusarium venenatum]|uniref:Uncharacterized protein n=1 Tax=Fusarium venenatum TaxID=56646 RepID=A0A2L2TCV3_9HYPO|nr:uncharacterized protein FVRRES_08891 [Fusarium venenatum]CEI68814.1 unnamed protein product [Fusarium venenatum]
MPLTARDRIIMEAGHFPNAVKLAGSILNFPYAEGRHVLFWRSLRNVQRATSRLIKLTSLTTRVLYGQSLQSVARSMDYPIWSDQVHTVPCVEIEAAGTELGVEVVVGERGV